MKTLTRGSGLGKLKELALCYGSWRGISRLYRWMMKQKTGRVASKEYHGGDGLYGQSFDMWVDPTNDMISDEQPAC